jgi:hypothetical protein
VVNENEQYYPFLYVLQVIHFKRPVVDKQLFLEYLDELALSGERLVIDHHVRQFLEFDRSYLLLDVCIGV